MREVSRSDGGRENYPSVTCGDSSPDKRSLGRIRTSTANLQLMERQTMLIKLYEERYRDDLIFMVLQAKDALGRKPTINTDLLDIKTNYFDRGDLFWVAINEDDRVVGCIGYSKTENPSEAFLHRLYVKAPEKHKGIGTKLLQTAENEMRKQGILVSLVHLGAPKEQWFESYAFYPRNGYQEYKPRYMRKNL